MNIIPLITTLIALVFTTLLFRQYLQRKKIHQILWTVAMLFYSITAFMEFLMSPEILGLDIVSFKIYYILAAPLVGLLGAGVVYLLIKRKIAHGFLGFVIIFSVLLAISGILTPLNQDIFTDSLSAGIAEGLKDASRAFPYSVRIYAILLNSIGGMVLLIGALYSYIRDRKRRYNLLLFLGALFPMLGGFMMGILNNPIIFFEFELLGTVFLFLGFVFSDRYLKKQKSSVKPQELEISEYPSPKNS
jgi:hypothetical protein